MPPCPPPNDALAELAAVLGEDNVRTLVRTFLRDFPVAQQGLVGGERSNRLRLVHSMKSNARLMGALDLSDYCAALEARLSTPDGADINDSDRAAIETMYQKIAVPLRAFVGA